jgi:threonine/homoserine/homoserine lactone efflux protein
MEKLDLGSSPTPHSFMNSQRDNNYISVGSWMWMMFVTAIPIIGWIMIVVWAFTGENESRKNYYRAILAWILVFVALVFGLILLGGLLGDWPAIQKQIQDWTHRA